jgi:hypothetical protein
VQFQAAPDSNVRPVPPRAPRGRAPVRLWLVARSLLLKKIVGVALLAAASSMSACIIPVGPNFQDPPTQPSSVPALTVSGLTPAPGLVDIIPDSTQSMPPTFSVTVADPDPIPLYYRWIFDYPPYTDVSRLGTDSSLQLGDPPVVTQKVSCDFIIRGQPTGGQHRLELLVSPSDWKNSDGTADDYEATVVPNAPISRLNWIIIFGSGC